MNQKKCNKISLYNPKSLLSWFFVLNVHNSVSIRLITGNGSNITNGKNETQEIGFKSVQPWSTQFLAAAS